MTQDKQTNFN